MLFVVQKKTIITCRFLLSVCFPVLVWMSWDRCMWRATCICTQKATACTVLYIPLSWPLLLYFISPRIASSDQILSLLIVILQHHSFPSQLQAKTSTPPSKSKPKIACDTLPPAPSHATFPNVTSHHNHTIPHISLSLKSLPPSLHPATPPSNLT